MRAATRYAYIAGTFLVSAGLLGFGVTGLRGFAAANGEDLFGLEVNPLHNLVHLLVGAALLTAAMSGHENAATISAVAAASFGVLGLLGFVLVGSDANVLAVNHPDNAVHLALAATGATAVVIQRRRRATSGSRTLR